jgi:preprotein translocase subunit SecF
MELFNPKKLNFKFSRYFKLFIIVSLLMTTLSIIGIIYPGLNYGVDFAGGVEAQVFFKEKVSPKEIRQALEKNLKNVTVVSFNDHPGVNEYSVKAQLDAKDSKESIGNLVKAGLTAAYGESSESTWSVKKMDVVGPTVGASLKKSALMSLFFTCLLITIYMYWRFDLRFVPGSIACIFHDITAVTGFVLLTGMEFSTTTVAALLTLAGYSINDTVVVYDRIRELETRFLGSDKKDLVDYAVNSTLSRTTMTAGTTLISCLVLYFLGGPAIRDFALVLFVGIIIGTYSSLYVASPLYIWTGNYLARKETQAQGKLVKARS